MNDLVVTMNGVLARSIEKAGSQVHFIDYDKYVEMNGGRYCEPGQDESGGKGADRPYNFFYQMKTKDEPWREADKVWDDEGWKLELRQVNEEDFGAINGTLGAIYGAMIQQAIEEEQDDDPEDDYAALEDDNANSDLDAEVDDIVEEVEDAEAARRLRARSVRTHHGHYEYHKRSANQRNGAGDDSPFGNFTMANDSATTHKNSSRKTHTLGSKVFRQNSDASVATTNHVAVNATSRISNSTTHSSRGTIIANSTHILLANTAVKKVNILHVFVPDKTGRVFHPTQLGHNLIANMILYQMAADNAEKNGTSSRPCSPATTFEILKY